MNHDEAAKIIDGFQDSRIAVVGDFMLDRYISGEAVRISPEAPVPVVRVNETRAVPGGAANVVHNISTLGARAFAFGMVGDDDAGKTLRELLASLGVETSGLQSAVGTKTIEKTRVLAGNQQIVRIDREDLLPPPDEVIQAIVSSIENQILGDGLDAIIIEDYYKGLINESLVNTIVRTAEQHEVMTALDPHPGNRMALNGITLMTPNRQEAFALAGAYLSDPILPVENDRALNDVAKTLHEMYSPKYLLITLGAQGMMLFRDGIPPFHIGTRAQEVFDVSGAGDTVISSFVLMLISGASPEDASEVANHAAGTVVRKVGTQPAIASELLESFTDGGTTVD